jgi:hypothetical protein
MMDWDKTYAPTRFISGMRVIETLTMVEDYDDWSRVRSPSRARRRQKYGYRQNIVRRQRPKREAVIIAGTLYIHPETARTLYAMLAKQKTEERMIRGAL